MKLPEAENAAYDALRRILTEGAYSSVELDRTLDHVSEGSRGKVTALVYGVLDKSVTLDYILSALAHKRPKNAVAVLIKLGIYEMLYGNTPVHAAVDKCVELAKARVRGADKFVNAVLRAAPSVKLPEGNDAAALSVRYSRPEWLVKRMLADLGEEKAKSILSAVMPQKTHIRRNSRKISEADFARLVEKTGEVERTERGYYVTRGTLKALDPSLYTAQSLSSIFAAEAYTKGLEGSIEILDACAAPGGKSVYMSELLLEAHITACDVHEHRVRLIKAYAARMGASNIDAVVADARNLRGDEKYDLAVCDVPCTGSGLLCTSPDILIGKKDEDVAALSAVQREILDAVSSRVRRGGRLVYSTCSLLTEENESVTDAFAAAHPEFSPITEKTGRGSEIDGKIRFFPDSDGCDGFYIARFVRN